MSAFPNLCYDCGSSLPLDGRHRRCPECRARLVPLKEEPVRWSEMVAFAVILVACGLFVGVVATLALVC